MDFQIHTPPGPRRLATLQHFISRRSFPSTISLLCVGVLCMRMILSFFVWNGVFPATRIFRREDSNTANDVEQLNSGNGASSSPSVEWHLRMFSRNLSIH